MDNDRFSRLRQVVDEALALPPAEREAFVVRVCAEDPDLKERVLALLAHDTAPGPALTGVFEDQVRQAASSALGNDHLPDSIGDYQIVEKLGEGGMGIVYRAEQTGVLERSVALKLIRSGWSSPRVIARFDSERLALARMDHPNIARIFDGGATADGRPWFAMELVEGKPLTEWCDEHLLDTRRRLELFSAVCRGVQHAHQKGIIHRDLKPSNVMVTGTAADPVPKIIDFGIAKALTDPLGGRTAMTVPGQRLGSVDYMSPEHIEGEEDVDIRSDVYSLGVLLYELLSGRLPFDHSSSRRLDFGSPTRERTRIDPPSLGSKGTGDASRTAEIAACRGTDPRKLRRLLKGELDWVVGKALAADRDHRYATARELMRDLERYLAGEPVEAGRPGLGYRLGKFASRHRVPVTVTAAVIASLALGLAESQRQRVLADAAREEAQSVTAFLSDMLSSVRPDEEGREVTVHQVLEKAAGGVGEDFADQPLVRAQLQSTIGAAFTALGETDDAIVQLEAALETRRRELGDEATETLVAMCDLGKPLFQAARYDRAGALFREALEGFRNKSGDRIEEVCSAMNGLANALAEQGRIEEAEPYYLEALEASRRYLGESHQQTGSLLNNLALLRADQGRMEECRDILVQVLDIRQKNHGLDHPLTMESILNLAGVESRLDMLDEAVARLEPLVPRALDKMGEGHRITLAAMNNLAWAYGRSGRLAEADSLTRRTLAIRHRVLGDDHPETLISQFNLADVLKQQGRLAEAEDLHRRTLENRQRVLGNDHPHTRLSRTTLAELLADEGRNAEADSLLASAGPR